VSAADALSRTTLLMRTVLRAEAPDHELLEALLGTEVALVADGNNIRSAEGQAALITAAGLIARSGAQCYLDAPNVALVEGTVAPLTGTHLVDALLDFGADLIPGRRMVAGVPSHGIDLAVVIGDSPWTGEARQLVSMSGDAWAGRVAIDGERWAHWGSPFGALASAGLAAGEAYKAAMRRVRGWASGPATFDALFAASSAAEVGLAPRGTPVPSRNLGRFDVISGGAIAHAALYALSRIPSVEGQTRVIEAEVSDLTNINRYAFLRRSRVGEPKAAHLGSLDLGQLAIVGVPLRYEERTLVEIGSLASNVLVGVDHVPSRWAVQGARPNWLGIGATSDYSAVVSFHSRGLPCARCLHPNGTQAPAKIPTAAFVSHWAGLWLASLFARSVSGERLNPSEQLLHIATLRPESTNAIWKTPGVAVKDCEFGCPL